MHNKVILLTFMVALSCQVDSHKRPKNFGRLYASSIQFPYIVSIHSELFFEGGGSIIADRGILTAAHCMKNKTKNYYVRAGSTFTKYGGSTYNVIKIIDHPNFDQDYLQNDISFLILEKPIRFSKNVGEIGLVEKDTGLPIKSNITVAGWGKTYRTEYDAHHYSLSYLNLELISLQTCKEIWRWIHIGKVTNDEFCTLSKNRSSCIGDSGGPAVLNGRLVGIMSWLKDESCPSKTPNVYTRVSSFNDWIRATASSNGIILK